MGLAAGSWGGDWQVANSRVDFCRSFRWRHLPRSEAGVACAGGVRVCITCALARRALCVAATTTSSFSSTGSLRCSPAPSLPPPPPQRPPQSPRRAAAVGMSVLCCSLVPTAHGPHRSWTAAPCAQLLATGVACDKWRIQKWPFATVSTSAACTLLSVVCRVCHGSWISIIHRMCAACDATWGYHRRGYHHPTVVLVYC